MLKVYVPALKREVEVTKEPTQEELAAMIIHGLKQKLTDAAAGKSGEEAEKAVMKRLETVWEISATRGPKTEPVWVEARNIVLGALRKAGKPTKAVPGNAEFQAWFLATVEESKREAILARARELVAMRASEIEL